MKAIKFTYFSLNNLDKNNHIEKIPVTVINVDHLFCMGSKFLESDELNLSLLWGGTRIDSEYLKSLEATTKSMFAQRHRCVNCRHIFAQKVIAIQEHLLSCKHWLFFLTKFKAIGFWLADSSKLQLFTNKQNRMVAFY